MNDTIQHKGHLMETVSQATVPVPVGVSGAVILGHTMQDWVLIGTGVLLLFQLFVMAVKVYRTIKSLLKGKEDPDE